MKRKRLSQADIDWALRIVDNSEAVILVPNAASVGQKAALVTKLLTERGGPRTKSALRNGWKGLRPRIYLLSYGERVR